MSGDLPIEEVEQRLGTWGTAQTAHFLGMSKATLAQVRSAQEPPFNGGPPYHRARRQEGGRAEIVYHPRAVLNWVRIPPIREALLARWERRKSGPFRTRPKDPLPPFEIIIQRVESELGRPIGDPRATAKADSGSKPDEQGAIRSEPSAIAVDHDLGPQTSDLGSVSFNRDGHGNHTLKESYK